MQFDAHCIECLVRRHYQLAMEKDDGVKADLYLRDVMRSILDAPPGVSAPYLTNEITHAYARYWPGEDAYAKLKQDSNDLILELLPQIRPMVERAADPLAMALKFARDKGLSVPEDLSIIGYDNTILSVCTNPEITSIDSKVSVTTTEAVNALLKALDGQTPPKKICIPGELIKRETTDF